MRSEHSLQDITDILGKDANLLTHEAAVPSSLLHAPSMRELKRTIGENDRPSDAQRALLTLFRHGRLGGTGYLNILPVDQGVEHSAMSSFGGLPEAFDPAYLVGLAIDGGCSAIASTYGTLAAVSRRYAHKIPFVVKLNHNELVTYPNKHDQVMFCSPKQAADMGAIGVGATVYFGSPESARQIQEVSKAFEEAHQLGLCTILWCYLRNPAFVQGKTDYHAAADLTAQALHLGVTIGADVVKQKLPETDGGFKALSQKSTYGKTNDAASKKLTTTNPIDRTRLQVLHCYAGRIPLLSSGGPSTADDVKASVKAAVINKRAGGSGLIAGRKIFTKPKEEAVELLHLIQDVYLQKEVRLA